MCLAFKFFVLSSLLLVKYMYTYLHVYVMYMYYMYYNYYY